MFLRSQNFLCCHKLCIDFLQSCHTTMDIYGTRKTDLTYFVLKMWKCGICMIGFHLIGISQVQLKSQHQHPILWSQVWYTLLIERLVLVPNYNNILSKHLTSFFVFSCKQLETCCNHIFVQFYVRFNKKDIVLCQNVFYSHLV